MDRKFAVLLKIGSVHSVWGSSDFPGESPSFVLNKGIVENTFKVGIFGLMT